MALTIFCVHLSTWIHQRNMIEVIFPVLNIPKSSLLLGSADIYHDEGSQKGATSPLPSIHLCTSIATMKKPFHLSWNRLQTSSRFASFSMKEALLHQLKKTKIKLCKNSLADFEVHVLAIGKISVRDKSEGIQTIWKSHCYGSRV